MEKADWDMTIFGDEDLFEVETENTPEKVETAVTAIWKGAHLMTPIGGGVIIEPKKALASENLLEDEEGKLAKVRKDTTLKLEKGQWWWD